MKPLIELKKELFSDGQLTTQDIKKLRDVMYADGGMTKEKGDFLFELKDTISPERQSEEFCYLFVEAISCLLLEDDVSPGEIDDSEAKWLRAKMQANGYRDKLDTRLLECLKERSINFPEILQFKGKLARKFEAILYFSRYLTIFAVVASIFSSIILFIKGTLIAIETLQIFFSHTKFWDFLILSEKDRISDYEELLIGFVSSVDIYLFAMVLIIFGMGIYELFISKIDPVERKTDTRPTWLQVSSLDDLKSSLGKVILMVLIVNFFKASIGTPIKQAQDLLFLSIGIVLVSLALYIANKSHTPLAENDKDE